ncbi:hypothetical protein MTsPCn5_29800 [Croceitalea sp. MTPC5]|uniref:hypothetical protein n=1 Tax=Croceitalea sp. MTPC5 TaxID=3056565 RepID=UPI002B3CD204|nr:hypothetical protein MTsPCn5_29800 [Croceitalea sp. MTPC5]
MKNLLFITLAVAGATFLNAQTTGQIANYGAAGSAGFEANGQLNAVLGPIQEARQKLSFSTEEFQGSPYTTDTFLPTKLYYGDENLGDLFYRYNAYNEEIEIKQTNLETEGIRALGRDKKIAIVVNGKPMAFETFIDKRGKTQNGYLTQLVDGKYSFYKRTDVKYTEGQKAQNSFVQAIPARFSQFTEYYLEIDGANRIDELELSNRKFIKLLPNDKKEATKAFLKENKIKINDEASVLKVLEFLNQD